MFYKSIALTTTGDVHGVLNAYHRLRQARSSTSPFTNRQNIHLLSGYRLEYQVSAPRSITYVLRMFLRWRATNKIDKIFAIIGLSTAGEESDGFLTQLVDYSRPPEETLLFFANHLIDTGQALKILDLAGIGWNKCSPELPSWVVDWRRCDFQIPMSKEPVHELEYNATRAQPSVATRGSNEREIVVRGKFIDRIALLASPSITYPEDMSLSAPTFSYFMDYVNEIETLAQGAVPDPYPHIPSQPRQEALWRTTIGDRTHRERPAPHKYGESLRTFLNMARTMGRHLGVLGTNPRFTHPSEEMQREFHINNPGFAAEFQAKDEDFQEVDLLFDSPGGQRRFAVTERKYMGMVPNGSEAGDVVCVLFGAKVPFILRECNLTGPGQSCKYQLVGEAYIHGMMDGEALDLDHKAVDFTIV
jgi:hypothetical protein